MLLLTSTMTSENQANCFFVFVFQPSETNNKQFIFYNTHLTLIVGASKAVLPRRALIRIPYIPLSFKR